MPATPATSPVNTGTAIPQQTNYRAMAMVTTLFFMWGFLTCLNDILIPVRVLHCLLRFLVPFREIH